MPKIVDKGQKRAAIARAAISACRERGYHRTRMADIAQRAAVGKGTLYEYFSSKDEILGWVFDEYFVAFKTGALEAMTKGGTALGRLEALVRFAFDHMAEWKDYCAVYVDYFGGVRPTEGKRVSLEHIYSDMAAMLRQLIETGQTAGEISPKVDPDASAELLLSTFDGIILHDLFAERRCSSDALRDTVLRLLSRGLAANVTPDDHD